MELIIHINLDNDVTHIRANVARMIQNDVKPADILRYLASHVRRQTTTIREVD